MITALQRAETQGITYREYTQQTKATMHMNRKPGELMEADWAGQTAVIIDNETGEVIDAFVFVAV